MATLNQHDIDQCNRKVDAILQQARDAQTKAYTTLPEIYIPYAKVCVEVAGLQFSKRDAKDWIKTFGEWMERGYGPRDVETAIQQIRAEQKILICRPGTITHRLAGNTALKHAPEARGSVVEDKVSAWMGK